MFSLYMLTYHACSKAIPVKMVWGGDIKYFFKPLLPQHFISDDPIIS